MDVNGVYKPTNITGGADNGIFSGLKPWCPQKYLKIDG